MTYKKIYILLLVFLLVFSSVFSQIPEPEYAKKQITLQIIGKSFGDSVLIRWAPSYTQAWLMGNKAGYNLFRYKIKTNNTNIINNPVREKLNQTPILPMPVAEIEKYYGNDNYAGIVAQAIYGESFEMYSAGKGSLINQAKELDNRFSFALFACDISVNAAKSHGLIYIDKNIEKGAAYVYTIRPAWPDTLSVTDSAMVFITVSDTFSPPKPVGLAAHFSDKSVELSWNFELLETVFNAYHVERSDDNGKTFKRININPVVNITSDANKSLSRIIYIDSLANNSVSYQYRVRGITPFGEIGQPSDVVKGIGIPQELGLNPIIASSPMQDSKTVEIKWDFETTNESRIKGFIIERATNDKGPFVKLSDTLVPSTRLFVDKMPLSANYYQVCAISKIQGSYCSFPALIQTPDSIPPAAPTGINAKIDSLGIVTLKWKRNTEPDIMLYSIFRGNSLTGDFVQINKTQVTDTFYTDTVSLNTLTKKVYYAITASDKHYNPSLRSEVYVVSRPDTIAPAPPSFTNYSVSNGAVTLYWNSSPSNDVAKQVLYRRVNNEKEWTVIAVFDSVNITDFKDTDITSDMICNYLLTAIDDNKLESKNSQVLSIKAVTGKIENTVILKLKVIDDEKAIKIEWKSKTTDIENILIYKSINGVSFELLTQTKWSVGQFIDKNIKKEILYSYRVQIINKRGERSCLGQVFSIEY
jgi:fibronectin type 3 domain-containing protein